MENYPPPDDGENLNNLFVRRKPRRRIFIVEEKLPPVELPRWDDLINAEADDMTRGMVTPSASPREIYEAFPELCWAVTGPFYDLEGRPYPGTDPESPTSEDIGFQDWQNSALRTSLNYADLIAGRPDGHGGWKELGSEMEARFLNEMAIERMAKLGTAYLPDFLSRHCNFYAGFHSVDNFVKNLADLLETEAGKALTVTRRQVVETWISRKSNERPATTSHRSPKTDLFKLHYGDRNASVIRALYDGLSGELIECRFEQWERLFTDNGQPLQPINWQGREVQLTCLFQGLRLDTSRIYRLLATHFRKIDGSEFNHKQLPVSYNKAAQSQPIVSDLIKEVNRPVNT